MMKEENKAYHTIDEYILQFPTEIQEKLQSLRKAIQNAAPEAKEKISWQMATYDLYGNLVHFAAHAKHIGFYPGASGIEAFKDRLLDYKSSKGAVQFPLNQPMPLDLVGEIVRFRVSENKQIAEIKLQKKKNKYQNKTDNTDVI